MVVALLGAAILAASIAGAVVIIDDAGRRMRSACRATPWRSSTLAPDPSSTRSVWAERPGPVAGAGNVWVLNPDNAALSRIDVRTRGVLETQGIGGGPTNRGTPGNVAASTDEVWVSVAGCSGVDPGDLLHVSALVTAESTSRPEMM